MHEAFENAGAEPGIEVWTIEQFEPVPVEPKKYGKFYNGDTYIVLKTTGDTNSTLSYDAHFWLGSKSTQDKRGAAAIWTVTLDDMLSGRAVHHREPQGYESSAFLGYFKPAIRYLEGGNESGFTEVETNAGAEKRLLKLSGCENMRIEEVPAEASSLTKDHCFILEVDHDIFVLMPEGAKATQRRKIISVANSLRDDYHNGRATIEIIDEFSSDDDFTMFFEALGSGSRDELADGDSSTTTSYRADISAVYLYRVLVGDELDLISLSKPYRQKDLSSSEIYFLDTPDSGVYIWLGSDVDEEVKKNYMDIAEKYLEMQSYPNWVNITRIKENHESAAFKQYFHNWETLSADTIRAFSEEIDAGYSSDDTSAIAKLIGKSAAVRGYMPDSGDGNLSIIRIAGGEEDVTGQSVFYQNEVYIVKYQYTNDNGEDAYVFYTWIGALSSDDDKQTARQIINLIESEVETNVTIVKMPQGKEIKHFLKLFKGNLAIICGNKDDEYKPENFNGNYDDSNIRLFRVEGTELDVDMRAMQVPERSDVLENDDVFILETADVVYIRNGKESTENELEAAQNFVKILIGEDKTVEVIEQDNEPDTFWEILGSLPDDVEDPSGWMLTVNRRVNAPKTLTDVTVKTNGKILFEDLDCQFTQQDLSDDGVYILDTSEELYLWQGKNVSERVVNAREEIIQKYIEDDGLERTYDTALVVVVKQGSEPTVFKKLFKEWDDDMWANQTSYEDMKNETKASNS